MKADVVSEWFAASDQGATEMRAAIERSRLGWPQLLHRHPHGHPCNDGCETMDPGGAT